MGSILPEPPRLSVESFLSKAHFLRRQGKFDEARLLLETALAQCPDNQEIKALLLQTEKDQITANHLKNKGDYEIAVGPTESPWQALVIGLVGLAGAGATLFFVGETVLFIARHGFAAQEAMYTRVTRHAYYVPAHLSLALQVLLFCFCVWIVKQAVKSCRS